MFLADLIGKLKIKNRFKAKMIFQNPPERRKINKFSKKSAYLLF